MMTRIKTFFRLIAETFSSWIDRDPFRNSTVIAYYTLFSFPGLLLVITYLVGYFFGQESVSQRISIELQHVLGVQAATDIEEIIAATQVQKENTLASILGVATILFGATGVFYQVQQTLNIIWEVKPKPRGKFLKLIKDRLFSFGLVLAIGFLLLVSLVLSAILTAISGWVTAHFSESLSVLFKLLDIALSLGVITVLFASIFKFLPDVKIRWRDVWGGAIITSLLFVVAKFLLGLYFGYSDPGSAYGAAGSIVLILVWVSYTGVILLFGAEFTRVYVRHKGTRVKPVEYAAKFDSAMENKEERADFKSRLSISPKH